MNIFRQAAQCGAGAVAVMTMAGGCAVGPNFVRPVPPEADRYTGAPQIAATVAAARGANRRGLVAAFWGGRPG